ncbi:MAG: winged helix-turn-helix transcriptional regulator [Candidatus Dormibacteria bacterium]
MFWLSRKTRLGELRAAGLLSREVQPDPPIASVYTLTASGAALRPALMQLAAWAHSHMPTSRKAGSSTSTG